MNTTVERQKMLTWLVVIGPAIACGSTLTAFIVAPFPKGSVSSIMLGIMLMPLLFAFFVAWQIWRHKNWARRLFLAGFFGGFPLAPWMFLPSAYGGLGQYQLLSRALGVAGFIYGIVFTVYLFKPEVRSMFIATPPQRPRQILYAVLAFGVGLGYLKFSIASLRYAKEHFPQSITPAPVAVPSTR